MSTEELLAQVLSLPREERARVAGEVLSSLEEPEDTVAEARGVGHNKSSNQVDIESL